MSGEIFHKFNRHPARMIAALIVLPRETVMRFRTKRANGRDCALNPTHCELIACLHCRFSHSLCYFLLCQRIIPPTGMKLKVVASYYKIYLRVRAYSFCMLSIPKKYAQWRDSCISLLDSHSDKPY